MRLSTTYNERTYLDAVEGFQTRLAASTRREHPSRPPAA